MTTLYIDLIVMLDIFLNLFFLEIKSIGHGTIFS